MNDKIINLEIGGNQFSIKLKDYSEEEIREIAEYLDSKMKQVELNSGLIEPYKLAILTALHITDELFQHKKKLVKYDEAFRRIEKWLESLEEKQN
ncbi:MAG: cell division protein ZapA [Acidobacteriota bacterium]